MSELLIRRSTAEDLQGIADLFLPRKRDTNMLHWLHKDQQGNGELQSFVAEAADRIIGHIGYIPSTYHYQGESLKGVFSIEWKVDEAHASQAALKLYANVLKIGDFTYVIGGTEVVNKMYPLLKFHVPLQIPRFQKILKPLTFMRLLNDSHNPLKRMLKTAVYSKSSLFGKAAPGSADIELTRFEPEVLAEIPRDPRVVCNDMQSDYARLMKTPDMESYPFIIRSNGKPLGSVYCMIDRAGKFAAGRIVHISFLGRDAELWRQVIRKCELFLGERGCCIVSALGSHPLYVQALKANGHVFMKNSPLWLRDTKKRFKDAEWHLTYLEGDLGHREIFSYDFTKKEQLIAQAGGGRVTRADVVTA